MENAVLHKSDLTRSHIVVGHTAVAIHNRISCSIRDLERRQIDLFPWHDLMYSQVVKSPVYVNELGEVVRHIHFTFCNVLIAN